MHPHEKSLSGPPKNDESDSQSIYIMKYIPRTDRQPDANNTEGVR